MILSCFIISYIQTIISPNAMQKSIIICAVLLAAISISCSSSSDGPKICIPSRTTGQITPLALGNWWAYKHIFFKDEFGGVKNVYNDTIRITQDTLINGEYWYYHSWGFLIATRPDGLWQRYTFGSLEGSTLLLYKYPANSNDTIVLSDSDAKVIVLSTDTSVSTGIGCYSAYCYVSGGGSFT